MKSVPSIPSMESIWSNANTVQQESNDVSSVWNDSERTNWLTFSTSNYDRDLDISFDVLKIVEDETDDYDRLSVFRKINST